MCKCRKTNIALFAKVPRSILPGKKHLMPAAAATSAEDSPAKLGRRSTELLIHVMTRCETNGEWKPEAEALSFLSIAISFLEGFQVQEVAKGLHHKSF